MFASPWGAPLVGRSYWRYPGDCDGAGAWGKAFPDAERTECGRQ